MIIPVGKEEDVQTFKEITKIDGKIIERDICGVRYVPLTDLTYQINRE